MEGSTQAKLCAVGLWSDNSVKILSVPDFQEVTRISIESGVIPRSVMFCDFDNISYLFIALGDGHLISYIYDLVHSKKGFL